MFKSSYMYVQFYLGTFPLKFHCLKCSHLPFLANALVGYFPVPYMSCIYILTSIV